MTGLVASACVVAAALLALSVGPRPAEIALAQDGGAACLEFDTELVSLTLIGDSFALPLVSDPGLMFGDSVDGYGYLNCDVTITLSSQRVANPGPASTGQAIATLGPLPAECSSGLVDPAALDGQEFTVESFFDVFFDVTVTDVDSRAGRDMLGQPDGASATLEDIGPVKLSSSYLRTFDRDLPHFGLVPPPETAPYEGNFSLATAVEVPLGGDINVNGENDKGKFTLVSLSLLDANRTIATLPDGTVVDSFDTGAFLEGRVVDESSDPPFQIGTLLRPSDLPDPAVFGGSASSEAKLLNPVKPSFSYVDANDDQQYDAADGDIALTAGEVEDGAFDTRKTEGGYTERLKGAGLVINGAPIAAAKKVKYGADGTLVVNTDLSAPKSVTLLSRAGTVLLDDPNIKAKKISIKAKEHITATGDAIDGDGAKSKVALKAGGSITLDNTVVDAGKSILVKAKEGAVIARGARLKACEKGKVKVRADKDVDLSEANARAYGVIDVRSKTSNVNLAGSSIATVDGSAKGSIKVRGGEINVGGATLLAPRGVTLTGTEVGTPTQIGEGTLPCGP
ncbi:MAG: hypothetical protein ACYS99_11755 [Planctomycetota bacterium]